MEWQPIETAPKDGREFLACWGHQQNVMQIVRWNRIRGYYETKGRALYGFSANATSWMHLPEPPK